MLRGRRQLPWQTTKETPEPSLPLSWSRGRVKMNRLPKLFKDNLTGEGERSMPLPIRELIGIGKGGFGGCTPFDIFLYVLRLSKNPKKRDLETQYGF
jgi:hypothetical protein